MRKLLLSIYKLMFLLIPIPLFYDFGRFQFFYLSVEDYRPLLDAPIIPMPIAGIAFVFIILTGYIGSALYPETFRSTLTPSRILLLYLFAIFPLTLYSIFIAGLSTPRIVQLLLPTMFISLLSLPVSFKDRLDLVKMTFLGAFLFFSLHFLSILLNSNNILDIDDKLEFSSFFGVLIYQSLVSYPGVMSLYFILTLAVILTTKKKIISDLNAYKNLAIFLIFVLLYLLAASGRRAFLVEYIFAFFVIIGFSFLSSISNRYVKKKTLWLFVLFLTLFFLFFIIYVNIPLSDRVLRSIEENTFDSGRINILQRAYDYFSENLGVLLLGGGKKDVPGFHNFILDQIYRIGLIGLLSVYTITALLIKRFIQVNDIGQPHTYFRKLFITILFSSLFLQSMINASISQPYYFINFLTLSILTYFVLFTSNNSESQLKTMKQVI